MVRFIVVPRVPRGSSEFLGVTGCGRRVPARNPRNPPLKKIPHQLSPPLSIDDADQHRTGRNRELRQHDGTGREDGGAADAHAVTEESAEVGAAGGDGAGGGADGDFFPRREVRVRRADEGGEQRPRTGDAVVEDDGVSERGAVEEEAAGDVAVGADEAVGAGHHLVAQQAPGPHAAVGAEDEAAALLDDRTRLDDAAGAHGDHVSPHDRGGIDRPFEPPRRPVDELLEARVEVAQRVEVARQELAERRVGDGRPELAQCRLDFVHRERASCSTTAP
ncbi:MAG TPA: hypothetical protein VGF28_06950 [Thermoanaerobaculia bacterium]|jgi:hypothetical protein